MKEMQAILREIVNDLEQTAAGLAVVIAETEQLIGGKSLADAADAFGLAKQRKAAFYKGIREQIDALSGAPPASENRDWLS